MAKSFLASTVCLALMAITLHAQPAPGAVRVIAHRGASGLAPENTMAAFEKAVALGADMIELDVHLSKDDSLIVMHDHTVTRTTDGDGEIRDLDYAYIAALDAGSWFGPEYKNERVPTLGQVLRQVDGRTRVLIELKWPSSGIYDNLVKNVLQTIRACHAESWVSIQSFETRYLNQLQRTAPKIDCQQLILGKSDALTLAVTRRLTWGEFSPEPGVTSVNPSYRFLTRRLVEQMHRLGLTVYPYTLNDPKKMAKAIRFGVDGIITNRPDLALALLKERTF